jgi:DNA-binding MarR family transcriptional regulator
VSTPTSPGLHDSKDLDDVVPFRISQTNRLLRTHLMRFLEEHAEGVSPEQWFILQRLAQRAPRRQVELSERVLADAPNVTRLIDTLVDRGLVERRPDPTDRRSWSVSLTPKGSKLIASSRRPLVGAREELFDGFGDEELRTLLGLLDRIDARVRMLLDPNGAHQ